MQPLHQHGRFDPLSKMPRTGQLRWLARAWSPARTSDMSSAQQHERSASMVTPTASWFPRNRQIRRPRPRNSQMPFDLTPYDDSPLCQGQVWVVKDMSKLAALMAHAIIGRHRHVAALLAASTQKPPLTSQAVLKKQIARLTPKPNDPSARWHRDGWLFQLMSWVVARQSAGAATIVRAPQPRTAEKGFDCLIVERKRGSQITVVIGEDKATTKPRSTIRQEVWPSFAYLEAGNRDDELLSEVTSLLAQHLQDSEVGKVLQNVFWARDRAYRVCITAAANHQGRVGRATLFKGYTKQVRGKVVRRRAETVTLTNLRTWMDSLSRLVVTHLKSELARV